MSARFLTTLGRLALLTLCLAVGIADARAAQPAAAPQISKEQAQQLLGVLDDPAKRTQFETTLRNLTQAQDTKSGSALVQSHGTAANVLGDFGALGRVLEAEGRAVLRTALDVRAIGPWATRLANDPGIRAQFVAALGNAAVFVVIALAVFTGIRLLLAGLRGRVAAIACARDAARGALVAPVEAHADAAQVRARALNDTEAEHVPEAPDTETTVQEQATQAAHSGAFSSLTRALLRLPLALAAAILDALPLVAFPIAASGVASLGVFDRAPDTESALRDLCGIALMAGGLIVLARFLLAPAQPALRLVLVQDGVARFVLAWVRRLALYAAIGIGLDAALAAGGMPEPAVIALSKIVALGLHILIAIWILRARPYVTQGCRAMEGQRFAGGLALAFAKIWWIMALVVDLALWLVWAAEIRHGYEAIWLLLVRSIAALVIVRLLSIALFGALDRGFRDGPGVLGFNDATRLRLLRYRPALRQLLRVIVALLLVLALALAWGAPFDLLFAAHGVGSRVVGSVVTVLIALGIGALVWEAANLWVERHVASLELQEDGKARVARIRTLLPMFRSILLVALVAVIGLTALSELGVNVAPLLAGASIFGVALGFGSQKLVQDFINGIFLLLENALTVGDAVTLNGIYGVVEHLSLRTVHVRANDGSMNIFPFSSLGHITNYNRDFARALIVAEVAYDTDTDDVVQALRDITAEMREDPDFKDLIIADFILWGVDSFNDSSVTVRGTLPTVPQGRWPVQRQFNRRMKKLFEARGIVLPFPTRTLEIQGLDALLAARDEKA